MLREPIGIYDLLVPAFGLWDKKWLLLTAGVNEPGKFNGMTVSWGGLGFMWGKPLAMVVVRPQRYTFEFTEKYDTFSLCVFGEQHRGVLNLLGTKSGRNSAKMQESGLTPMGLSKIACPGFAEAELIIECRKTYFDDYEPKHFLADYIAGMYHKDYHRMYFGEVVAVEGTGEYRRK